MKKMFFVVIFCVVNGLFFAESNEGEVSSASSESATHTDASKASPEETSKDETVHLGDVQPSAEKKSDEAVKSEAEERRDIINYGLESDVLALIKELQKNEDDSVNDALASIFSTTTQQSIRVAILELFASQKVNSIETEVLRMLENMDEYSKPEVNALLLFSGELKLDAVVPFLQEIIKEKQNDYLENAIIALGKIGSEENLLELIETYQNIDEEDEKKEVILKEAILKSLAENAPSDAEDFLCEVAEDEAENIVVRSLAVSALSSIKTDEVFQKLVQYYSSSQPLLRMASIKGIAGCENEEARKIMLEACKDSYHKVRAEAIKSIELNEETVNYLLYRAKKDPEQSLRLSAIERLSEAGSAKANEYLVDTFKNEKTANSIRAKIAESLLKNNFELIIGEIENVATEITKDEKNKPLRLELGRIIAKIENERTATIAELYLRHKDTFVKSLGLDMFSTNRYTSLTALIEEIANDEKMGALQRRAKSLLK